MENFLYIRIGWVEVIQGNNLGLVGCPRFPGKIRGARQGHDVQAIDGFAPAITTRPKGFVTAGTRRKSGSGATAKKNIHGGGMCGQEVFLTGHAPATDADNEFDPVAKSGCRLGDRSGEIGRNGFFGIWRYWEVNKADRHVRNIENIGLGLWAKDCKVFGAWGISLLQGVRFVRGERPGVIAEGGKRLGDGREAFGIGSMFRAVGQNFEGTRKQEYLPLDRVGVTQRFDEGSPPGQPTDKFAASGRARFVVAVGVAGEQHGQERVGGMGWQGGAKRQAQDKKGQNSAKRCSGHLGCLGSWTWEDWNGGAPETVS